MTMSLDFIIIHGSPGCGKTTLARRLHDYYESPYFEFGWIPEYRTLAPSINISQRQEEQLSFENLISVTKNYNKYGFKNVIITDLDDVRMLHIPTVYSGYNYAIITLFVDDDTIIKNRIIARDNGNLYRDWGQSVALNAMIKKRCKLPNEYRVLNDRGDADVTLKEIINILALHAPSPTTDFSALNRKDFYSYIEEW